LEASHPLERTSRLSQAALLAHPSVDAATRSRAAFALSLAGSRQTYVAAAYSRSGRSLLLGGASGHVAAVDWRAATPRADLFLAEPVRDVGWLHTDSLFAVAQRKYAYIYDAQSGGQVHVLRNHVAPAWLAFLPHHLLLASAPAGALASTPSAQNAIHYTDVSTGAVVGSLPVGAPKLGLAAAGTAAVNVSTGTLHTGHANGVVAVWSPTAPTPLARVLSHKAGVSAVAVSPDGRWAATSGVDAVTAVWDLRTWLQVRAFRTHAPVTSLDISATGMLALTYSSTVEVYKDAYEGGGAGRRGGGGGTPSSSLGRGTAEPPPLPYMVERLPGTPVARARWVPYEDLLGVVTTSTFRTLVIPGAGEAAVDSRAPNPYASRRARREMEVRAALEKLPPASIGLSTDWVGGVEARPEERARELRATAARANAAAAATKRVVKKGRGRNKIGKQLGRKRGASEAAAREARRDRARGGEGGGEGR